MIEGNVSLNQMIDWNIYSLWLQWSYWTKKHVWLFFLLILMREKTLSFV
jgi:hypothetical protein